MKNVEPKKENKYNVGWQWYEYTVNNLKIKGCMWKFYFRRYTLSFQNQTKGSYI